MGTRRIYIKKQGVPFAYHVFAKGKHGLSLADENWGYGRLGEPYCLEQMFSIIEAVRDGKIPMSKEQKEAFLRNFDFLSDEKAALRDDEINAEVRIWPELAQSWLSSIGINGGK